MSLVADALGAVGVETHPVPDAELDLMAIEHRHLLLFGERDRIALAGIFLVSVAMKDRLVVGRLDDEFGLEQPGGVSELLGLLLTVDEEQRDAPERVPFPDQPLDLDLRELGVRRPVESADLERDRLGDSLALGSLPDQLLVAALGREGLAAIPVIVAPPSRDLKSLASRPRQKVMPNDDGNIVLAAGEVLSAAPSSLVPLPPWGRSSNSSGESSCRLGASMPTR